MRVFHILAALVTGDAVSNDALALNRLLVNMGYRSRLFVGKTQQHFLDTLARNVLELPQTLPEDVLIYHLSTGDELNERLAQLPGHKLIIYHNITPPEFFAPYDPVTAQKVENGYRQMAQLAPYVEYCIADSSYNAQELRKAGYTCPIDVVPILIPFEDYRREADAAVQQKYNDGRTNLLFVGRVAPNKRQEDVIRAFDCYCKLYDPTARLFLVGSYDEGDSYYRALCAYCKKMAIENVIFPGHIRFEEILAYYRVADAFVCMSDHEGFCVPLAEAMCFEVPIVAKNTSAVGDTLGGGGLLLKDNDPMVAAAAIHRVLTDTALREQLDKGQKARLEDFSEEKIAQRFQKSFLTFLEKAGLEA